MKALRALVLASFGLTGLVLAAPPGAIDGQGIKTDFAGNWAATQNNYTQFGDYKINSGGFVEGNETDELFLAASATHLYIGVTGNLATQGNAWIIGIGIPSLANHGQTENRSEGQHVCNQNPFDPPWTLPESAHQYEIVDVGTDGDPSNDIWTDGINAVTGLIFPCKTDYIYGADIFGGTLRIHEYELLDPAAGTNGFWDPTPDNIGDLNAPVYSNRLGVAETGINDGDAVMISSFGMNEGGFDNNNLAGVTGTSGLNADTATSGLEFAIPFTRLGLTGTEDINVYVLLMDGSESSCVGDNYGFTVNQVLPPLGGGAPCDPPSVIGLRPDLSAMMSCATVNVAALPAFTGTAEGLISPADYGGAASATQTCPTPYGDQFFDPNIRLKGSGSELDALYVTSDAVNLYIGMTGNLEENGNKMNIWIDNGVGTDGVNPLTWDDLNNDGMEGDNLPPFPADPMGARPLYDYALSTNIQDAGDSVFFVHADWWDLVGETSTYKGRSTMEDPTPPVGELVTGMNQWGMEVALNNTNEAGVVGCQPNEAPCVGSTNGATWFDSDGIVEAWADQVTTGFEISIPLADLGLNPCDGPFNISVWAHVTGGAGWRSNQSLPPMRFKTTPACAQVENNGNLITEWYDPNAPCGPNPGRYYRATVATHTTTPGIENDCDTNGTEDVCDILNGTLTDADSDGIPDVCQAAPAATGWESCAVHDPSGNEGPPTEWCSVLVDNTPRGGPDPRTDTQIECRFFGIGGTAPASTTVRIALDGAAAGAVTVDAVCTDASTHG
ncbi:MAG: hypothetical protein GY778_08840, partial [bacterium]|nr:hypothetical protein [bacterium]